MYQMAPLTFFTDKIKVSLLFRLWENTQTPLFNNNVINMVSGEANTNELQKPDFDGNLLKAYRLLSNES